MNGCLKVFLHEQITNYLGSEQDFFSKTSLCKTQLDEKILPFHDVFDHFVFLYFSAARQETFGLHNKR